MTSIGYIVNEYNESPLAPTVFVNGVGGICRLGASLVKVTFVAQLPTATGLQCAAVVHLIWPEREWISSDDVSRFAMTEFYRGRFRDGAGTQ